MKGINKVILVATLGKDPETKTFANGGSITNFSVATTESWVDKNSGERKDNTEWHSITANGKLAEICQKYLKKGSKVYLEGSLRTRKWQDRYTTEIRLNELQMLDSKQEQSQPTQQDKPSYSAPKTQPKANLDDDLPF